MSLSNFEDNNERSKRSIYEGDVVKSSQVPWGDFDLFSSSCQTRPSWKTDSKVCPQRHRFCGRHLTLQLRGLNSYLGTIGEDYDLDSPDVSS